MKEILLTIMLLSLYSCQSQNPVNNKIEKFNIEKFNNNKSETGQYSKIDDGTIISRSE